MPAGGQADREAWRHARRGHRLRAEQYRTGDVDGRLAVAADRAERNARAWAVGAEGERRVAAALSALQAQGWQTLHDVRWPGRAKANIDHIAVGPGGVVVIDAKNWTGEVSVRDGTLRQNGYSRDREAVAAASATAAVTALLLPHHRMAARSVICLVGQPMMAAGTRQGVDVVGVGRLADHLASLPARLAPHEIGNAAWYLSTQLSNAATQGLQHHAPRPPVSRERPRADWSRRDAARVVALTAAIAYGSMIGLAVLGILFA